MLCSAALADGAYQNFKAAEPGGDAAHGAAPGEQPRSRLRVVLPPHSYRVFSNR
jgi:hypothetical protein